MLRIRIVSRYYFIDYFLIEILLYLYYMEKIPLYFLLILIAVVLRNKMILIALILRTNTLHQLRHHVKDLSIILWTWCIIDLFYSKYKHIQDMATNTMWWNLVKWMNRIACAANTPVDSQWHSSPSSSARKYEPSLCRRKEHRGRSSAYLLPAMVLHFHSA